MKLTKIHFDTYNLYDYNNNIVNKPVNKEIFEKAIKTPRPYYEIPNIKFNPIRITRAKLAMCLTEQEFKSNNKYKIVYMLEYIPNFITIVLIYNETLREYSVRRIIENNALYKKQSFPAANDNYRILSNQMTAPGQFWNDIIGLFAVSSK